MPPQLHVASTQVFSAARTSLPPVFLLPFLQQQTRSASIISSLSDVPSAYNKRIRRGRGPSSGKGKTSGRGHKGQKQHGKVPYAFQGGQTVEHVVKGIRGEEYPFSAELSKVNLDTIQSWIDQSRLDSSKPITLRELARSRAIHGVKPDGVKLLARGCEALKTPIHIIATRASSQAIAAVEAAGGTVTTRYYTPSSVRRIMRSESHPYVSLGWKGGDHLKDDSRAELYKYRLPDPVGRKDLEYYRDAAHRGYLSYQVGEGDSPSLYFKTPEQTQRKLIAKGPSKAKELAGNRIW